MEFWIYNLQIEKNDEIETLRRILIDHPDVLAFFDSSYLVCEEQMLNALMLTKQAFEMKSNFSQNFGIELYLKLSGLTQIKQALPIFDLTENSENVVLVASKPLKIDGFQISDGLPILSPSKEVRAFYDPTGLSTGNNFCDFAITKSVESLLR